MYLVVIVFTVLSGLIWLFQLYSLSRTTREMPRLRDFQYPELEDYPLISVIITACNEAETIEAAMASRLADDYPHLEFILIDDRSTDGTGQLVDRIAAQDARIRAFHITELPEGWLGKVHALQKGVEVAHGEWFLFSDADVFVKAGTLKQLIARCEMENYQHVAMIMEIYSGGFWVDTTISVVLRTLMAGGRVYQFSNPDANTSGGSGAFNLVKRSAFEKTKGFPYLKMEIIDDVSLGQQLKLSGARTLAVDGKGFVGVQWYSTFKGMMDGIGRAGIVALGNYNIWRHLGILCSGIIVDLMPYVALFWFGVPYLPYLGGVVIAIALASAVLSNRILGLPIFPGVLLPLGHVLTVFVNIRGGLVFYKNKGIYWRGTFYSQEQLKDGHRFLFNLKAGLADRE